MTEVGMAETGQAWDKGEQAANALKVGDLLYKPLEAAKLAGYGEHRSQIVAFVGAYKQTLIDREDAAGVKLEIDSQRIIIQIGPALE